MYVWQRDGAKYYGVKKKAWHQRVCVCMKPGERSRTRTASLKTHLTSSDLIHWGRPVLLLSPLEFYCPSGSCDLVLPAEFYPLRTLGGGKTLQWERGCDSPCSGQLPLLFTCPSNLLLCLMGSYITRPRIVLNNRLGQ